MKSLQNIQKILIQVAPFSLKWTTSFLETALANKSSILQIFLQSKSGINQTTDSIVMAKKFTFSQQKVNFLALTFESVVWLIPNFGCRKICRIDDLFAKAVSRNEVVHLSEKGATWVRIFCSSRPAWLLVKISVWDFRVDKGYIIEPFLLINVQF